MKSLMLFLFFSHAIFAHEVTHFSQNELNQLEIQYGKICKSRIIDYEESIDSFLPYPPEKQMQKVNLYLNQLLPSYDDQYSNTVDHWATPKEFLIVGRGDCEDYAILKYFTLIRLGFDREKLYLCAVHEKYKGSYHMVLAYFADKKSSPLILDNLSFRILDLKSRKDLHADIFINHRGIFKLDSKGELLLIQQSHPKFAELLERVQKGL